MATSAFTRRITAGEAVKNVMRSLGLTPPGVVSESQDPVAVLLWYLATRAGQKLLAAEEWQFLDREQQINTVIGQSNYALPVDFDRYTMDAQWNRTTRLPVVGALSDQEWQMLKARQLGGTTFTMLFRIADDQLEFYDTPRTSQRIVLPYVSRGWVQRANLSHSDYVNEDTDLVRYDRQLFEAALRLEWDIEKKFDTAASTQAYNTALNAAKAKNAPGRTRTLNRVSSYPYLGVLNIPDTGYGT